jgi:histidine phosphotransferase ChpT
MAQDSARFDGAAGAGHTIDLRVLELLTARLCHELSGPVAAINNGVELLAEEGSDFAAAAAALIGDSARRAGNRLQFYRFAYSFSHRAPNTGPAPYELAAAFFGASRIVCDYPAEVRVLPLDWQKLACNLLLVGADALPRGGRLVLAARPLTLKASGEAAVLLSQTRDALMLSTPCLELTTRTVQPYFTGLLARMLDCRLIATAEPREVRLAAAAVGI